jgi:acyl dehydratase
VSARSFDDVAVGDELPELRRVILREDVKDYADAGRDQNPLHQDDDFARSVGFDGIIAHGMFTMGHMAACVGGWAGDPEAILEIGGQFRAPVAMGEEIVTGGSVRQVDPEERTVTLETWVSVMRADGTVDMPLKRGEAVVRLR